MSFNPHLGNIFQVYARADRWDKSQGLRAYSSYHDILAKLADANHTPIDIVCAVFAALSPNTSYTSNLRAAQQTIEAFNAGRMIDSFSVPTYGNNKAKAWSILKGQDPLAEIKAPKTRSFYLNLLHPTDPRPVTIDGHMFSVWSLERTLMKKVPSLHGAKYERIARDFRQAATVLDILPNQLQAICWFTWRRIHNLFAETQPSLFEEMPLR